MVSLDYRIFTRKRKNPHSANCRNLIVNSWRFLARTSESYDPWSISDNPAGFFVFLVLFSALKTVGASKQQFVSWIICITIKYSMRNWRLVRFFTTVVIIIHNNDDKSVECEIYRNLSHHRHINFRKCGNNGFYYIINYVIIR